MKPVATDALVEAVAELRAVFPEMRFAQLILAIATSAGATEAGEIYDVEDDALLEAARRLLANNRDRLTS